MAGVASWRAVAGKGRGCGSMRARSSQPVGAQAQGSELKGLHSSCVHLLLAPTAAAGQLHAGPRRVGAPTRCSAAQRMTRAASAVRPQRKACNDGAARQAAWRGLGARAFGWACTPQAASLAQGGLGARACRHATPRHAQQHSPHTLTHHTHALHQQSHASWTAQTTFAPQARQAGGGGGGGGGGPAATRAAARRGQATQARPARRAKPRRVARSPMPTLCMPRDSFDSTRRPSTPLPPGPLPPP